MGFNSGFKGLKDSVSAVHYPTLNEPRTVTIRHDMRLTTIGNLLDWKVSWTYTIVMW